MTRSSMPGGIRFETLNAAATPEAFRLLFHCCGSERWTRGMVAARPFRSETELLQRAEMEWQALARADWLEAFSHHPKIGDLDSLRKKFKDTAHLASGEQSGVKGAAEATLIALAEGNKVYEEKFGYIFIVCATGKSADEMLAILRDRLDNDPSAELVIAAGEQKKITHIRLAKIGDP